MDIVVSGRNVEVPDHYRVHVAEKLSKIERFDHKLIRIDVELHHERNRRQSSACQHVEITCKSRGPAVRSEACAADFYAALDAAVGKLEARLRRAADRRRVHYGQRRVKSVLDATTEAQINESEPVEATSRDEQDRAIDQPDMSAEPAIAATPREDLLGRVVRHKEHDAKPMSVDQALHEMELVGHDFYLFADAESGLPSVVYRRKGYAYGVIRLKTPVIATPGDGHAAPAMTPPAARLPSAAETIPAQSRAFAARA